MDKSTSHSGIEVNSSQQLCAIGLDVGGTKIAGAIVAFPSAEILAKLTIPTLPKRGGKAVLSDSLVLTEKLSNQAVTLGRSVLGIGVGIAELVDLNGEITSAQTIDWRDLPVRDSFSKIAPTIIESDVRAPALAEAMFGAGRQFKILAYVTVGTGISYALVQDGRPYRGARGNAIILSSGALSISCPHCGTESLQVLEEFASGPAIVNRYNQSSSKPLARGEEVIAAAAAGDSVAVEVVRSAGESLGNSVGFLINVLDPEAVIVGGGLGLAGGLYWQSFVSSTRQHVWSDTARDLPILPAALGVDAGVIGAAAFVWAESRHTNQQNAD